MTEMDMLDIAVLKEQVFPHILKEHISELSFPTQPERLLFFPPQSQNIKLANEADVTE